MKRKASPTVTAEMAGHIKYLWHVMGLYQHQIAALLGINQGRVSEVVNGKRHPGLKGLPLSNRRGVKIE
jgi:predicted XRE-type DNA-binding protein